MSTTTGLTKGSHNVPGMIIIFLLFCSVFGVYESYCLLKLCCYHNDIWIFKTQQHALPNQKGTDIPAALRQCDLLRLQVLWDVHHHRPTNRNSTFSGLCRQTGKEHTYVSELGANV
jgi:hypothetical protein